MAKTMQEAAKLAIEVQDACNLSGVLKAFSDIASNTIWPEANRLGKGTDWVNQHPICTLFLDKLSDLNGRKDFGPAYLAVCDMAEGKEPEAYTIEDCSRKKAENAMRQEPESDMERDRR